jgi:transcriptional regulator with XRE-family HTH domain
MSQPLKTYLRPKRRRWGFTQRELAFLIGAKSSTVVSRIEAAKRAPSLAAVVACAIIFEAAPLDLFPGVTAEIQKSVYERVTILYEELQGNSSKTNRMKLDFLETLLVQLSDSASRV